MSDQQKVVQGLSNGTNFQCLEPNPDFKVMPFFNTEYFLTKDTVMVTMGGKCETVSKLSNGTILNNLQ